MTPDDERNALRPLERIESLSEELEGRMSVWWTSVPPERVDAVRVRVVAVRRRMDRIESALRIESARHRGGNDQGAIG